MKQNCELCEKRCPIEELGCGTGRQAYAGERLLEEMDMEARPLPEETGEKIEALGEPASWEGNAADALPLTKAASALPEAPGAPLPPEPEEGHPTGKPGHPHEPGEHHPPHEFDHPGEHHPPHEFDHPGEHRPPHEFDRPGEHRPPHEFDHPGEHRPPHEFDHPGEHCPPHEFDHPGEHRPPHHPPVPPHGPHHPPMPGGPMGPGHGRPRIKPEELLRQAETAGPLELLDMCHRELHRPDMGVARGQGRALALLAERGAMSQRELQDMLRIQPASMSELIGKLERKGCLTRERGEDRRSNLLRVTEAGKEAAASADTAPGDELLSALTSDQRDQLAAALRTLLADWLGLRA